MARLIDADALEKFIKEKYKDGESTDDVKDQMLFDLSYQPTAYDVEKVVEELKEASYDETQDDMNPFPPSKVVSLRKTQDIVRKGGVE